MIQYHNNKKGGLITEIPIENDAWQPVPRLMTQNELVRFLRIPEISSAIYRQGPYAPFMVELFVVGF